MLRLILFLYLNFIEIRKQRAMDAVRGEECFSDVRIFNTFFTYFFHFSLDLTKLSMNLTLYSNIKVFSAIVTSKGDPPNQNSKHLFGFFDFILFFRTFGKI